MSYKDQVLADILNERDESTVYKLILDRINRAQASQQQIERAIRSLAQKAAKWGHVQKVYKGIVDDVGTQLVLVRDVLSERPDLGVQLLKYIIDLLPDLGGNDGEPDESDDMGEMEMAADEPTNELGESGYADVTDQRQPGRKALTPNPATWQPPYRDPGSMTVGNRLNSAQIAQFGINQGSDNLGALFGRPAYRPDFHVPINDRNDIRNSAQSRDNLTQPGYWDGKLKSPFAGWPLARRRR